ncbi:MAG: MATE family efflux transporter [Cytophagales bacterium]|jgi:putative MATE family efflux protein|nr:MATE family efflux transporter [Cytophagales bacterium]MCA6368049.1 MATE family efflux transporter [Cytophagales bacterium]MCA6370564.1 MATE family efflux transporter [Cytophagales bacterium]MCA6375656.1 MATE family efflux transporter [Cytophagales bacterium]MCA6384049.1 MATE family efflux transporter [Cytophagales bacterium]
MKSKDLRLQTGYKQILSLAMPISLALIVPQINFITNNVFLGGLGEKALASAAITGVYYLIFAVIGSGLNNGLQSLIARKAGENQPKEIGKLFYHGVWAALGVSFIGILISYTLAPMILRATIHNQVIAEEVIGFIFIRIWGLPFLYLYVMRNALLVGTNQTKFLVWGTLTEAIANIFFDYAFIYGHFGFPKMGFNGAAYASIIAEATGLLVIFAVIHAKGINKAFGLFESWKLELSSIKLILFKSTPLILQFALSIVTWEYFYILIEHHGARDLAVSNTMRNVFGLAGIFSWAFAATANTMVSNVIGQGKQEEVMPLVKRIAKVSASFSITLIVILNIFPGTLLSMFGQGEDFIAYATPVLRVVSSALFLQSFSVVWLNAVTGSGNTVVNLIIEIVTLFAYILYVYLVLEVWNMSITWGWVSEWVYWICMFSMAFWYMRSGKWKNRN